MSSQEPPAGSFDRTVNRKVKVERKKDNFAQAGEMAAERKESMMAQESQVEAMQSAMLQSEDMAPRAKVAKEGIRFKLSDGRTVVLREPQMAVQFLLIDILGPKFGDPARTAYATALMYLVELDGVPVDMPKDALTFEHLANRLGTQGLEEVLAKHIEKYLSVDLDALKKNLQG